MHSSHQSQNRERAFKPNAKTAHNDKSKNGMRCPTVARDIQLDEAVKVLNIRGQTLDLVVAQAQLPQPVQPEETLETRNKN